MIKSQSVYFCIFHNSLQSDPCGQLLPNLLLTCPLYNIHFLVHSLHSNFNDVGPIHKNISASEQQQKQNPSQQNATTTNINNKTMDTELIQSYVALLVLAIVPIIIGSYLSTKPSQVCHTTHSSIRSFVCFLLLLFVFG